MLDQTTRQSEQRHGIGRMVAGLLSAILAVLATSLWAFVAFDYATEDYPGSEAAVGRYILVVVGTAAVALWVGAVALLRARAWSGPRRSVVAGLGLVAFGLIVGFTVPAGLSIAGWAVAVVGVGVAILGLFRG